MVGGGIAFRSLHSGSASGPERKQQKLLADAQPFGLTVRAANAPDFNLMPPALKTPPYSRRAQRLFNRLSAADPQDGKSAWHLFNTIKGALDRRGSFESRKLAPELLPPISAQQAVELAEYYYFSWVRRHDPSDHYATERLSSYPKGFVDSLIEAKAKAQSPQAATFLLAVRRKALECAKGMLDARLLAKSRMEEADRQYPEKMEELEREKARMATAIRQSYGNLSEMLSEWIEHKSEPVMDKLKKYGLTAGAIVTVASKFLEEYLAHIPVIGSLPPEVLGVALAAAAFLLGTLKWPWKAALWMAKTFLPKRREAKVTSSTEEINAKMDEAKQARDAAKEWAERTCHKKHGELLEGLRAEHGQLLSAYGYAPGN